jgi:hypothetical protein
MPLARIITKSADDSLELSMQLRSRGFRVETVAPDQIPSAPADLEVCLEECAPEEVLTKAALVKESEDLWVFVAPGALDERSRPMRTIPLIPQVVEFRIPEHIAAAVTEIKPKAEVPLVEVRPLALEPEDDPILSDLAVLPTLLAAARQIVPTGAELPAKSERTTPVMTEKHMTAEPVQVKAPVAVNAKPTPVPATRSLERIKRIAVTKPVISQIPIVPERVEPKLFQQPAAPIKPRIRGPRKSYKVAFQTGPKLWRTASVTLALLVLAGLLAIVVAVRPPVPASQKAPVNANPTIFLPAAQASTAGSGPAGAPASAATAPAPTAAARKPIAGRLDASHPDAQNQRAAARHRRSASDDGTIAEDTVIFYDRGPAPRAVKKPPAADVKRYSDAN